MQLADWLAILDRDRVLGWVIVQREARSASQSMRSLRRAACAHTDDLVHDATLRALRKNARAPRNAKRSTPLGAWLRGVMIRILLEERRDRRRALGSGRLPEGGFASLPARAKVRRPSSPSRSEAAHLDTGPLTKKQLQVWKHFAQGRTVSEIAEVCALRRDTVATRLRRACARLTDPRSSARADRAWVHCALRVAIDPLVVRVLERYARGDTYEEIARGFGTSGEAMRSRIRRLRNRYAE